MHAELKEVIASMAALTTQVTALSTQVAVHIATESQRLQSAPALLNKLDDLWDWRNRIIGAMAFIGFLSTCNLAGLAILFIKK